MLLGPGSQKSYILEKTAQKLEAEERGEVKLCHLLFGGAKTYKDTEYIRSKLKEFRRVLVYRWKF